MEIETADGDRRYGVSKATIRRIKDNETAFHGEALTPESGGTTKKDQNNE
jgi:hypothetical protein